MACIGQVVQKPVCVTVEHQNCGCCCNNIITPVDDIYVLMKRVNVTILRGTVLCASNHDKSVEGIIVVATDGTNYFVGITNCEGEYSICVPIPEECDVTYEVQAYCCCNCKGDLCEETECNCNFNEERIDTQSEE